MPECCEAFLVVTLQSTTRNILHDRRPQMHNGGNVKSRKHRTVYNKHTYINGKLFIAVRFDENLA